MNKLNRLKKVRQELGLSLEQLSALSGVSKSEINDIEKGKKIPGQLSIIRISDALGLPANKIFVLSFKCTKFPF